MRQSEQQRYTDRCQRAGQRYDSGDDHESPAVLAEGAEKARPRTDPNRIHEQQQPQVGHFLGDAEAEVPEDQSGEQHARCSQCHPAPG